MVLSQKAGQKRQSKVQEKLRAGSGSPSFNGSTSQRLVDQLKSSRVGRRDRIKRGTSSGSVL